MRRLGLLAAPQELYVERRVARAANWVIEQDGDRVGYAIVETSGTLLELFYEDALFVEQAELLGALLAATGMTSGLCQSFDRWMMSLAAAASGTVEPVGVLFRTIDDPCHRARADVAMRPAGRSDVGAIAAINDGFFADEDEILRYLDSGGLFVLEAANRRLVGSGIIEAVIPGRPDIDVGMLVAPEYRRRGYGAFIVSFLKFHLLSQRLRPICGCGFDNVGSRKAIQKAGFAADHRLLLCPF